MKKMLPRILLTVFVLLLAGSFLGSLQVSSKREAATHQAVLASSREKEKLQLTLLERQNELALAAEPLNQEKLIRDTSLYKNPGEGNLDLATFEYHQREVPDFVNPPVPETTLWARLLDPLAHFFRH